MYALACNIQGTMTTLRKLLLAGNPMRTLRRYDMCPVLLAFHKLVVRILNRAASILIHHGCQFIGFWINNNIVEVSAQSTFI